MFFIREGSGSTLRAALRESSDSRPENRTFFGPSDSRIPRFSSEIRPILRRALARCLGGRFLPTLRHGIVQEPWAEERFLLSRWIRPGLDSVIERLVGIMEPTVLYAEDDVNDITLMELVVARCGENLRLKVVRDGSQAIAYLNGEGRFTDPESAPTPSLILLDVKMPRLSGIEVLEWLRRYERFSSVAVVMISSSMQEADVLRAYELGANAYIGKPAAFKRFEETVSGALRFFLSMPASAS